MNGKTLDEIGLYLVKVFALSQQNNHVSLFDHIYTARRMYPRSAHVFAHHQYSEYLFFRGRLVACFFIFPIINGK